MAFLNKYNLFNFRGYNKRIYSLRAPDIVKVKIKEIITNIKEEAKTTVLTPRNLVNHAVKTLPTSIIGQLANIKKMSKTIRRRKD